MGIISKGRTTLPSELVENFTIKPGDCISFALTDEEGVYRVFCSDDIPYGVKRILNVQMKVGRTNTVTIPTQIRILSPSSFCIWYATDDGYYLKFC